jgi:hypothetical protein
MSSFTQGKHWKTEDGREYFVFTRQDPVGHFEVAVQVHDGRQHSPMLKLHGHGYGTHDEALAAGREVLEAYFGMSAAI